MQHLYYRSHNSKTLLRMTTARAEMSSLFVTMSLTCPETTRMVSVTIVKASLWIWHSASRIHTKAPNAPIAHIAPNTPCSQPCNWWHLSTSFSQHPPEHIKTGSPKSKTIRMSLPFSSTSARCQAKNGSTKVWFEWHLGLCLELFFDDWFDVDTWRCCQLMNVCWHMLKMFTVVLCCCWSCKDVLLSAFSDSTKIFSTTSSVTNG